MSINTDKVAEQDFAPIFLDEQSSSSLVSSSSSKLLPVSTPVDIEQFTWDEQNRIINAAFEIYIAQAFIQEVLGSALLYKPAYAEHPTLYNHVIRQAFNYLLKELEERMITRQRLAPILHHFFHLPTSNLYDLRDVNNVSLKLSQDMLNAIGQIVQGSYDCSWYEAWKKKLATSNPHKKASSLTLNNVKENSIPQPISLLSTPGPLLPYRGGTLPMTCLSEAPFACASTDPFDKALKEEMSLDKNRLNGVTSVLNDSYFTFFHPGIQTEPPSSAVCNPLPLKEDNLIEPTTKKQKLLAEYSIPVAKQSDSLLPQFVKKGSLEKKQKITQVSSNPETILTINTYKHLIAALEGNVEAQLALGTCYYFGKGVLQDFCLAAQWCKKAALQGNARAQFILGSCYYYGRGVNLDKQKALEWFTKAALQGHPYAKSALEKFHPVSFNSGENHITQNTDKSCLKFSPTK